MSLKMQERSVLFPFLILLAVLASCRPGSKHQDSKLGEVEQDCIDEPIVAESYGFDLDRFRVVEGAIGAGDVLSKVLMPLGVGAAEIDALVRISEPVFDVRKIRPKHKWLGLFESDSAATPSFFIYEKNRRDYVVFSLKDSLSVWEGSKPTYTLLRSVEGRITSSLYQTLADLDVSTDLAMELSSIYAWTIDFYRLQADDAFQIVYEEEFVDGVSSGRCTILSSSFTHSGKERRAYRYFIEGAPNYFDREGESLRKAFLKAPVKFSRISSRFTGKRFHPVLKRYKAHLGTDYAAPHGTPIVAVGDGTVTKSSYTAGNGKYVKIRHNGTYETQYLHMSKRAVKEGQYVQQGEVIGYVGSTGLATGPHVCFRFWKNGQQVDHLREEFPSAEPVPDSLSMAFQTLVEGYDALMTGGNPSEEPTDPYLNESNDEEGPLSAL